VVAVVLYYIGTPEAALMIERVGFTGDALIRVEERPPDRIDVFITAVQVSVPEGVNLHEHGLVSGRTHRGSEWLLPARFLNQFPRARWHRDS
jgi:hypothetical protein